MTQSRLLQGMLVSVIVCTRNRANRLRSLLSSLAAVSIPEGASLEIVVVDNGSTDDTRDVCRQSESRLTCRYVFEPAAGKSRALNRGVREAAGEVVAFTDDDCVVDRLWLEALIAAFETDPDVAVAGGRVELYDPLDHAMTLVTHDRIVDLRAEPMRLLQPLIIGANMAFRRQVFDAVGDFDPRLGPGSKGQAVFEEVDYIYRAYRRGLKIVYFPGILVFHNHGRRTDAAVAAAEYSYLVGRYAFYIKHPFDTLVLKQIYWDLRVLAMTHSRSRVARRHIRAALAGAYSRLRPQ